MPKKTNIYYRIRVIIAVCAGLLFLGVFIGAVYPVNIFDLQLGALLQRIFIDFSAAALVLLLFILTATLLFGRIYCSTLCPLGLLQEILGIFKKKNSGKQKNYFFKYIIAATLFGALAGGTVYLLRLAEPYTYFASAFTLSALGIAAVFILVFIVLFKDRFFCTKICPVGTVLGLISKSSAKKYIWRKKTVFHAGYAKIYALQAV